MEGLVPGLRAGEPPALEQFFHAFGPAFRRFLLANYPIRSEDAEEIADELVFRIALKKVDRYAPRPDGSFLAWVWTVARTGAIDALRRRRYLFAEMPEGLEAADLSDAAVEAERNLISQEVNKVIDEALGKLTAGDREILSFGGLGEEPSRPLAEIAALLGISRAAAAQRRFRALERMRKLLRADLRLAELVGVSGAGE